MAAGKHSFVKIINKVNTQVLITLVVESGKKW